MGMSRFPPPSSYPTLPPSSSLSGGPNGRFSVGDAVEVINRFPISTAPTSYYEATIISCLINGNYIVEYNTLLNDDDNYRPLRKIIGHNDLRPLPPKCMDVSSATRFSMNQMVDVYDEEGWWVTVITGKKEADDDRYLVYCYWTPIDRDAEVLSGEIRVHHEWFGEDSWVLF